MGILFPVILIVVVLVTLGILLAIREWQKISDAWESFAKNHGLEMIPGTWFIPSAIRGNFHGVSITIEVEDRGTGPARVRHTRVSGTFASTLPEDLQITSVEYAGKLAEVFGGHDVTVGIDELDRELRFRGRDKNAVRTFLNKARILRAVKRFVTPDLEREINFKRVTLVGENIQTDHARLQAWLDEVVDTVNRIDDALSEESLAAQSSDALAPDEDDNSESGTRAASEAAAAASTAVAVLADAKPTRSRSTMPLPAAKPSAAPLDSGVTVNPAPAPSPLMPVKETPARAEPEKEKAEPVKEKAESVKEKAEPEKEKAEPEKEKAEPVKEKAEKRKPEKAQKKKPEKTKEKKQEKKPDKVKEKEKAGKRKPEKDEKKKPGKAKKEESEPAKEKRDKRKTAVGMPVKPEPEPVPVAALAAAAAASKMGGPGKPPIREPVDSLEIEITPLEPAETFVSPTGTMAPEPKEPPPPALAGKDEPAKTAPLEDMEPHQVPEVMPPRLEAEPSFVEALPDVHALADPLTPRAQRLQLVDALKGRTFAVAAVVDRVTWSTGVNVPAELNDGRTVVGKVRNELTVAVRYPPSRNDEIGALETGTSLSIRARIVEWDVFYRRLVMDAD